ncbi:capsule assembly Wzi family protein [Deminuibacter soli]|uniref:Capsule assembly Wzi family protein n=1 Tax=Deminuibacter soli TaxID=2291815 RepID=A0A3E1NFJ9_9BACT|nr:hypothetical protein [Deminuibacter soli]RFM26652.1 hypothetical protein DXN05_18965 [Deminuibacter soli]
MPIRKYPLFTICIACLCLFLLPAAGVKAQPVWENYRNEIYNYLYRMAQKGLIHFDDIIRPVTREKIGNNLQQLLQQEASLSPVERKELHYYLKEYSNPADTLVTGGKEVHLFQNDSYGRWRAFSANNKDVAIYADPIAGGAITAGNGESYTERSIGLQFWGKIGKHVGFQFYGRDVTQSGSGRQTLQHAYSPSPGYVLQSDSINRHNYSDIRGSITYQWRNGSISAGQDYLLWGYGINSRLVLSDKSPAYPYLRLDYQPFKWLSFNYTHAWLNSDLLDSGRTYSYGNTAYGGKRNIYISKFMAQHSFTVHPVSGLDFSLGESIVYSDRLDIGYLFPLMFFKVYDNANSNNDLLAGANGQFFFLASARNLIPKTHLYSTLLIDEIKIADVFDKNKSRNQLGYNVGASVTDCFIPYLTLNAEYTRINPFVYRNLNPAQNYTNHSLSLGDWLGSNSDRFIIGASYTPFAKVKCLVQFQATRKGGPGTIDQQYFAEPQPPFLFDRQFSTKEWLFQCSYQWIHNLYLQGYLNLYNENNQVTGLRTKQQILHLGIQYGL